MKNSLLLCLLGVVFSVSCYAQSVASVDVLTKEEADLAGKIMLLEQEAIRCGSSALKMPHCENISGQMSTLYAQAAKFPRLIRSWAMDAMFKYQKMEASEPRSAMQVSQIVDQQNARLLPLIVLQNQRIIELLEIIAKKPK